MEKLFTINGREHSQNPLWELSKDKEDKDGKEKPRRSVGYLVSLLSHPNSHCLSSRLVHSSDKADGEDGEEEAGDELEGDAVQPQVEREV